MWGRKNSYRRLLQQLDMHWRARGDFNVYSVRWKFRPWMGLKLKRDIALTRQLLDQLEEKINAQLG